MKITCDPTQRARALAECVFRSIVTARFGIVTFNPESANMGGPSKAVAFIDLEDYLALETASRYQHEYLDGVIYAIPVPGTRERVVLQTLYLVPDRGSSSVVNQARFALQHGVRLHKLTTSHIALANQRQHA